MPFLSAVLPFGISAGLISTLASAPACLRTSGCNLGQASRRGFIILGGDWGGEDGDVEIR